MRAVKPDMAAGARLKLVQTSRDHLGFKELYSGPVSATPCYRALKGEDRLFLSGEAPLCQPVDGKWRRERASLRHVISIAPGDFRHVPRRSGDPPHAVRST
jgi:hypothetical protein